MQYIHSLLSIAGALLTITGAFIAGWFVATDKNRSELFKQKLGAYKNLSGQISKVYTLGVALEEIEGAEADSVYRKEAAALLNMLLSEAIFIEEHSMKQISKFIQWFPPLMNNNEANGGNQIHQSILFIILGVVMGLLRITIFRKKRIYSDNIS